MKNPVSYVRRGQQQVPGQFGLDPKIPSQRIGGGSVWGKLTQSSARRGICQGIRYTRAEGHRRRISYGSIVPFTPSGDRAVVSVRRESSRQPLPGSLCNLARTKFEGTSVQCALGESA